MEAEQIFAYFEESFVIEEVIIEIMVEITILENANTEENEEIDLFCYEEMPSDL